MMVSKVYFSNGNLLCLFPEQKKKESDDIDHDAIAHRLKQDVVSVKFSTLLLLISMGTYFTKMERHISWDLIYAICSKNTLKA